MFALQILSIILLITYPFMSNLHGLELKILVNIASILKNVFAVSKFQPSFPFALASCCKQISAPKFESLANLLIIYN
jgi:hypothetical protein